MQISTLPALSSDPLTKRTVPLVQLCIAVGKKTFIVYMATQWHINEMLYLLFHSLLRLIVVICWACATPQLK